MKARNVVSAIFTLVIMAKSFYTQAEVSENWFQQPAISPSGENIAFSAKGDIFIVDRAGGTALPLVTSEAWDGYPIWSHDNKSIAFASDRNGSLDVYLIELATKAVTRLTYHSSDDYPTDFTTDNQGIIFHSGRMPAVMSSDFPTTRLHQLYSVSVKGGTPERILTTATLQAKLSADGNKIVYTDNKAYEDLHRKHDVSSFARDIWFYDISSGKHTQLTTNKSGDSNPVWGADGYIYYLSEQDSNNFNLWRMKGDGSDKKQLTFHKLHPARSLTASDNGLLVYSWHGELHSYTPGRQQKALDIALFAPKTNLQDKMTSVANKAERFELSPNGKEIAFISRGELFVTSIEFATTVKLTDTAEQERGISWFPDGRAIAYAAEKDGSWGIYKIALEDEHEPYFFAATKFSEQTLINNQEDQFQPLISPDGKQLAYLNKRDEIRVLNLVSGKSVSVFSADYNYSYSDGDISFVWSPDSQWIAASYIPNGNYFFTNIGIAPADGSAKPKDITLSGYADFAPVWNESDSIQFISGRFGRRNHGSWGNDFDIMSIFLTQQAFDDFNKSKEERTLDAELAAKAKKDKKDEKDEKEDAEKPTAEPVVIEWDGLQHRVARLTKHSSDFSGASGINYGLTKDNEKLFYLAKFEKGMDLWVEDFKDKSTKLAVKLNAQSASIQLDAEGKIAAILADGKFYKVELTDNPEKKPVKYSGDIALNSKAERAYLFNHIWRQTKDKFYNPSMHGVDWDVMYEQYLPKATNTQNNRDFAFVTSELLGELNASHTGTRYFPNIPGNIKTASIGVIFADAATSKGIEIAEILPFSPLLEFADKVQAGHYLTHVDGKPVNDSHNLYSLLTGKEGTRTRLTLTNSDTPIEIVIRPISLAKEFDALYTRWVESRRELVDKWSDGKLGYVHIPQMNDEAYRMVYAEIFGRSFAKQGIVIDTRFNRGGWLTDDLVTLFSGEQYTWEVARGKKYKGDSMKRWTKPSIVVMNEGNYSDGYCFPKGYTLNKVGKTVGMPVPGTCTAVWWERLQTGDLVFGIPQLGVTDIEGTFMENNQLEPTIKVENTKESVVKGEDLQLQRAVKELLK